MAYTFWSLVLVLGVAYLYLYKIGALFDLRNQTPPRPLALEG